MTSRIQAKRPDLLCGTEKQQYDIILDLIQVMQNKLEFNLCKLPTSHLRNVDMPDIKRKVDIYIPNHLKYSCRFWADHLKGISFSSDISEAVNEFLIEKFLFWLEVLSILGIVRYAPQALSDFILWTKVRKSTQFKLYYN
jgi:hypothetical protein